MHAEVGHGEVVDVPGCAAEVAALAAKMRAANGPLMRFMNRVGGTLEDQARLLPTSLREGLGALAERLLIETYRTAAGIAALPATPRAGSRLHRAVAALSGAAGGAAGLGSAVLELPATVALIFGAMQKAAAEQGYDPASEEVRKTCLDILGSGGPGSFDDGVDASFLGARLSLSGTALSAILSRVAPRFGAVLGQKLASQIVPVLGAAAGAGVNYVFMAHYQQMAQVRFGLKRLAETHGEDTVVSAFRLEMARHVNGPPRRL
jgi:hypothetical protein